MNSLAKGGIVFVKVSGDQGLLHFLGRLLLWRLAIFMGWAHLPSQHFNSLFQCFPLFSNLLQILLNLCSPLSLFCHHLVGFFKKCLGKGFELSLHSRVGALQIGEFSGQRRKLGQGRRVGRAKGSKFRIRDEGRARCMGRCTGASR